MSRYQGKHTSVASAAIPLNETDSIRDAPAAAKPLLQHDAEVPPGWPKSAKPLKPTVSSHLSTLAIDIALLALAVSFLAFAIAVRHYDQAPTAEHIQVKAVLIRLSKLGPSIFPILFAAIIGRATHALLLWRLEKGERIGTLDMLASSTSLTSTVVSQLQLRLLTILGVILLLVWALSPIGGQSSIQQLGFSNGTTVTQFKLDYLLPGSTNASYGESTFRANNFQRASALFLASLFSAATITNSTLDLWNNVRIPKLEEYEKSSTADMNGWYSTNDSQPVYASLIGTVVYGFVPTMNESSAFSLETSYLHLDCPVVNSQQLIPYDLWSNLSNATHVSVFHGPGAAISLNYNGSCGGGGIEASDFTLNTDLLCTPPPGIYLDQVDSSYNNLTNPLNTTPRNFTYLNWATSTASFCTVTTTYVEAEVTCNSTLPCKVSRLRRSRLDHRPPAYTVLDEAGGYGSYWTNGNWGFLIGGFITSLTGHSSQGTALQAYLEDPVAVNRGYSYSTPSAIANATFALRQGQLMNAYWTCLSSFSAIAANSATYNETLIGGPQNHNTTIRTTTRTFEVIACHFGWNAMLMLVSSILIVASLINPIIRILLIRAPDLLLNFSSLATRDNRYVDVPETGTTMDAAKRARLMKDLKVRYGDVDPTDVAGRLAISSIGTPQSSRVGHIRKGRLYI